jgi:hypothetical protein
MAMSQSERNAILSKWMKPSSESEQTRQERAETMVRAAIAANEKLKRSNLLIYTKGSYPNNTNVRLDSDVDVVVELQECFYYGYRSGVTPSTTAPAPYVGNWTPRDWRAEVKTALATAFGSGSIDTSSKIAIEVNEVPGSRPSADVVPSFAYHLYNETDRRTNEVGSCVFPSDGAEKIVNWPNQQLTNGRKLNNDSGGRYKDYVRILKNTENYLAAQGTIKLLPSYLMECLIYNVPTAVLSTGNLDAGFRATLVELWKQLGAEDTETKMVEPNWLKYLFTTKKKWTLQDAKDLVQVTWSYFEY